MSSPYSSSPDPDASLPFAVMCGCGQRIGVDAGMAGEEVACRCGKRMLVPRLSELRRAAGQEAYGDDPVAKIRGLRTAGISLPEGQCSVCRSPASQRIVFRAECEREWVKRRGTWDRVLFVLLLPFSIGLAIIAFLSSKEETHRFGRDVVVDLPVTICENCAADFKRPGQTAISRLLVSIPLYASLLEKYPRAEVFLLRR
jgi:hypothetical protein